MFFSEDVPTAIPPRPADDADDPHQTHCPLSSPSSMKSKRKRRVSRVGTEDEGGAQPQPQDQGKKASKVAPVGDDNLLVEQTDERLSSSWRSYYETGSKAVAGAEGAASSAAGRPPEVASAAPAAERRPRKQSRIPEVSDSLTSEPRSEADVLQRKQGLIDKLKSYANSSDEDDFDSEDDGDVSGEDVFSDDEEYSFAKERRQAMKMEGLVGNEFSAIPIPIPRSIPQSFQQALSQPTSYAQRGGHGLDRESRQINKVTSYEHQQGSTSYASKGRGDRGGGGGGYRLCHSMTSALDRDLAQQPARQSIPSSSNSGAPSQRSKEIFARMQQTMFEQHNNDQPRGELSPGYRLAYPPPTAHNTAAAATSHPRDVSFHSRSSAGRNVSISSSPAALTASQIKSRGIFANLEAEIMQQNLDDSNHSGSSSSRDGLHSQSNRRRRSGRQGGDGSLRGGCGSIASNVSSLASWKSRRGISAAHVNDEHGRPEAYGNERSRRAVEATLGGSTNDRSIEQSDRTSSGGSLRAMRQPVSVVALGNEDRNSRNIIANMEAVMSQRAAERPRGGAANNSESDGHGRWRVNGSNNSFQQSAAAARNAAEGGSTRSGSSMRGPSREVIASIEADILRMEEEDNLNRERSGRQGPYGSNVRSGATHGSRHPAGMNQREMLNIMMMQQQQRQRQQQSHHQHHPGRPQNQGQGGGTLADQISSMAIDPLNLELYHNPHSSVHHSEEDCDSSDTRSINSCASYDGKCTNVHASRARTPEQELACHALNTAICDVYGAPVGRILRKYPAVTRLIRADDGTNNVQLHYAVRNGNVKAIRRIVRADPGCALIRNIQGYCPLHFAVQIGNFAAVQLLCCMVPASAEVQCEEGCLPLHEAVSSAAHLPDAPQITAALINAFPSAIKITNDEGLLPLHLAAMSGFSAGIRTIFAYGFSTIYARENTEEMLPLDFAVDGYRTAIEEANEARIMIESPNEEGSTVDIAALTEKELEFRQCIDIFLMSALYDRPVFTPARSDQRGMTFLPIHGAAAAQPCSTSWKQIVSMYGRDYASDVDVRGRTALHVLVTSTPLSHMDVVVEMIDDINELDPTSATTFDDGGFIPLHAALTHAAPYDVIKRLLACNQSTVGMEVDEDCDCVAYRGMLPFQLAAASGCSVDVVNILLRGHPVGVAGALPREGGR